MSETGLQRIKRLQQENADKEAARNRPKAEYLNFNKLPTNTITVRFLQELDETALNYNEERGKGEVVHEHQAPGPNGYLRRANCTAVEDDSSCYACERHQLDRTLGWKQRTNLYINALVDWDGNSEGPKVFVLSRNFTAAFSNQLFEEAIDEGTITDKNYRITKNGEKKTTTWTLKALDAKKSTPLDDSQAVAFSIEESVLRAIPYEKQPAYYGEVFKEDGESVQSDADSSDPVEDASW